MLSNAASVAISSGIFDPTDQPHCGMWVQAKVLVLAGGQPPLNEFRKKVHVGFLQNLGSARRGSTIGARAA